MPIPYSNPFLNKLRGVNEYQTPYMPQDLNQPNNLGGVSVKAIRTPKSTLRDYKPMNLGAPVQPAGMTIKTPGKPFDWKGMMGKMASAGQALAPYASNIANAFRKPPMPITPQLNNYQSLSKVNMDNDRYRVNREVDASSAKTDQTLDANTAAKVRASNLGTKLNGLSQISEQERNANTGIANQQAQMDMQTDYINKERMNGYNDSLVERGIAQQTQQSANLSNAADKYIGIQNEKQKQAVDLQKTQMLGLAFSGSGVDNALRQKAKAQGLPDPYGRNFEGMDDPRKDIFGTDKKKYGGSLKMRKLC